MLPLGTGNDLARVLGWGSALDDDSQLPKLLESFERATTKMLDRWSMMTYELPINTNDSKANLITSKKVSNTENKEANGHPQQVNKTEKLTDQMQMLTISSNVASSTSINVINRYNLVPLKKYIWFHLNNIIQSDNTDAMIESSQILNSKLNELLMRVNDCNHQLLNDSSNKNKNVTSSQYMLNVSMSMKNEKCLAVRHKLDDFFSLLKSQLKTNELNISTTSFIDLSNSNICTPDLTKTGKIKSFIYSYKISS